MSTSTAEVVMEVCERNTPPLRMPYARAFLDGRPDPISVADISRLVRLMAYDLIRERGAGGTDPAGIYAAALELIHATKADDQDHWQWSWEGMNFKSSPCPEKRFAQQNIPSMFHEVAQYPSMDEWRQQLELTKIPCQIEAPLPKDRLSYPSPERAMLYACLLVVSCAQVLVNPARVCIWFDRAPQTCLLIELWNE